MTNRKKFYFDLLERSAWTFVQALGMTFLVDNASSDLSVTFKTKLTMAATAGGIAVLKSLVVNKLPWTADNSASTLPESVDPPAED